MSGVSHLNVTIVVNGKPTDSVFPSAESLHGVIAQTLAHTGNIGQPPENWVLTDVAGNELDPSKHLNDYITEDRATLFLTPRAGIGG